MMTVKKTYFFTVLVQIGLSLNLAICWNTYTKNSHYINFSPPSSIRFIKKKHKIQRFLLILNKKKNRKGDSKKDNYVKM